VSVEGWDQEFLNYWNLFDMGPDGEMVTGTPAAGDTLATSTPATGEGSITGTPSPVMGTGTPVTGGAGTLTVSEMQGMILAEDLLGLNLVSLDGDPLGEVEDAVIDLETGVIRFILLSADASLDIAGNWVPVPLETLSQGSNDELVLDVDDDAMNVLVNAPKFDANSLPDTGQPGWDLDITDYWSTVNP
jgi:sporulation protein YlmC with PRC-barrel domain